MQQGQASHGSAADLMKELDTLRTSMLPVKLVSWKKSLGNKAIGFKPPHGVP